MVRRALRWLAYPLTTGGAVAFSLWALGRDRPAWAVGAAVVTAAAVVVELLERAIPYSRAWSTPRGDKATDVWHFAVSNRAFDVGIRMRTPAWLDLLVCTPAVHRHHHSRARAESDTNFGDTVMIFDLLVGTYGKPRPVGPEATGLDDDPVPRAGFFAQVLSPFRLRRSGAEP
jgi:hypothetical protein